MKISYVCFGLKADQAASVADGSVECEEKGGSFTGAAPEEHLRSALTWARFNLTIA